MMQSPRNVLLGILGGAALAAGGQEFRIQALKEVHADQLKELKDSQTALVQAGLTPEQHPASTPDRPLRTRITKASDDTSVLGTRIQATCS